MDDRLSLQAIDDYSEDLASKLAAAFFATKDSITGPEILKLSPIHQVNLFVIRELLSAWKYEGQKLRSPYFDYTAAAVKQDLERLQNTLSNHIVIAKENFQPLLKKAISQTLFLILDPYDFFSDVLDKQGKEHIRAADLRNEIKYMKINRAPMEKLVQRLEERKLDLVPGKEAFGMLDQILEEVNFNPEEIDQYLNQFAKIAPVTLEKLYEKKPAPITVPKAPRKVEVKAEPVKKEVRATLADNFQRIASIKDSLTINQKFMFTKILFRGDFEIFSDTINQLDRFENLEQATRFLEQTYSEWNRESEEFEEFMELVEKRFA